MLRHAMSIQRHARRVPRAIRIPIIIKVTSQQATTIQLLRGPLCLPRRRIMLAVPNIAAHRRCLPEPPHGLRVLLVVDQDDHPHAHCARAAEQRRAVNPARAAFLLPAFELLYCVGQPADLGCYAAGAVGEGVAERVAHALGAADAVEEMRLHDAGDAEGGGGEENAEGRRRANEEVL